MSGICGVWRKDNPAQTAATLESVRAGLGLAPGERVSGESHQGVGLGLSARFVGQQIYDTGRTRIVCDAELYNEPELTEAFGGRVNCPQGANTAALMAGLYERFGCGFVEKLRGPFSMILWDSVNRRFLAAVDGFAIKRLAWYENNSVLLVATRVDALGRSGEIEDPQINPRAIVNVLNFTSNLGPETVFADVHRLAPGSTLTATNGSTRVEKYWDLRYQAQHASEKQLSAELERVVQDSVAVHCNSGSSGELGAFLSGGTDSSTVVGMMTRKFNGPVNAFSIGFQEQPFNELGYAEIAARRFQSRHFTYLVGPDDCFQAIPDMLRAFDEPFGNSSAIPTYFCARLAAQNGVSILLGGDGGDELFGGNERYATDKLFAVYQDIPRVLRRRVIEPLVSVLPTSGIGRRAHGYVRRANMSGVERMLSFQFLKTHSLTEIFEGDFLQSLGDYNIVDIPARHYAAAPATDHLNRLLYVDLKITLADNDLPKVTCMSEVAGIQARFPFLDRTVAEFSGRLSPHLKVKGFKKRYLFKKAFQSLLPIEIIKKPKHGFGIPVANWIQSDKRIRELTRDSLLSSRAFSRGYFRRQFIEELFRKHDTEGFTYYGDTLWAFLALELWHRNVADRHMGIAV